ISVAPGSTWTTFIRPRTAELPRGGTFAASKENVRGQKAPLGNPRHTRGGSQCHWLPPLAFTVLSTALAAQRTPANSPPRRRRVYRPRLARRHIPATAKRLARRCGQEGCGKRWTAHMPCNSVLFTAQFLEPSS